MIHVKYFHFEKISLIVNNIFSGICSLFIVKLFTFFLAVKNKSIMSRSINKQQTEIILSRMQENRQIACGFVKESRENVATFWKSLVNDLNSAGRPTKNITEWKKVWTDQKRYVRLKAAANMNNQRATGGGPNWTKYMSETEKCIYELVGIKEAVEGVENSTDFGFSASSDGLEKENEPPMHLPFEDLVAEALDDHSSCPLQIATPPSKETMEIEQPTCSSGTNNLKRKYAGTQVKLSTADLIAKELKSQEDLCSKVCNIGDVMKTNNKELSFMMKRIYRALEKNNDLKARPVHELERHNEVFEKFRQQEVDSKIEKNKKIIEVEEMKQVNMRIQ